MLFRNVSTKSKFNEMFKGKSYEQKLISKISESVFAGGDKPSDSSVTCDKEYKYPVYSNGQGDLGLLCYSKTYQVAKSALTISARGTIGFTCIRKPFFTPVVRLITLIPNENINLMYMKYCIDTLDLSKNGSGAGQLTVPDFMKYSIMVPPIDLQNQFADFAQACDKLKFIE
ncbi:MAG: restriction endonuclease subunit S [Anaerostipes sp.]|nr:restriction endonuclease subunit S [Anaerostipes sp.]